MYATEDFFFFLFFFFSKKIIYPHYVRPQLGFGWTLVNFVLPTSDDQLLFAALYSVLHDTAKFVFELYFLVMLLFLFLKLLF